MRVFLAQANDRGFYGVEQALESLGLSDLKVLRSYFRGARFPLTRPLPQRLDPTFQAYPGLLSYQLIVLAGVDPACLTTQDAANLVSFVAHGGGLLTGGGSHSGGSMRSAMRSRHGGGLLIVGGTHSLGRAEGTYELLRTILPVEVLPVPDRVVASDPVGVADHAVTRGIPLDSLGHARLVQPLIAKPDASVLLAADGLPLLVVGQWGQGRVAVLATYPDAPDGIAGSLFASPFYDDLLRQLILWLTWQESSVLVSGLEVGARILNHGETAAAELALHTEEPQEVRVTYAVGRDSGEWTTHEHSARVEGEVVLPLAIEVGSGPADHGPHHAVVMVNSEDGVTLARRDWTVDVIDPDGFDVRFLAHQDVLASGEPLALQVRVGRTDRALTWQAAVIDAVGQEIIRLTPSAVPVSPGDVLLELPNLVSGVYRLVAELLEGDKVRRRCVKEFHIVEPLPASDFFSISAEAGTAYCDEALIRHHIDDVIDHGFNTVVVTGMDVVSLDQYDWEHERLWMRMLKEQERYAQVRGAAVSYNYGCLPHSFSRTEPMTHCRHAPGHSDLLRQKVQHQVRTAARVPRLVSLEILDEPLVTAQSVCRCEHCQRRYAERYGRPMPTDEELPARPERERLDYYQFLSDYWDEEFRELYQFAGEVEQRPVLNLTLCGTSFGLYNPRMYFTDAVAWGRHCDWIDFDIYPYFYPLFRAAADLPMHSVHYNFGGHRVLARHYGKPLGFFVEIEDRNYPQILVPVNASVEVLYMALAQGVDYVKTFINLPHYHAPTQERWDRLGQELRRINRYGALLTRVARPRARVTMLFGYTDWLLRPKTRFEDLPAGDVTWDDRPYDRYWPYNEAPINAFELLTRAFGEADLVPEQLLDAELGHYGALLVTGIVYLPRAAAHEIERFVRSGGVLLTDGLPQRDEDGMPLVDIAALNDAPVAETIEIDGPLQAQVAPLGDGLVIRFSRDLADTYAAAFENDDPLRWQRLEEAVRRMLFDRGLRPAARANLPEVEAGLRRGVNCALLVLANHAPTDVCTQVSVYEPGFSVGWVVDPATGEEIPFDREDDTVVIDVRLPGRDGRSLALYPVRPHANRITVEQSLYRLGDVLAYVVQVVDPTGVPALGHHVLEIQVTDPTGEPRHRYGGQRTTADGELQVETPLAVNEHRGIWQISVFDRLTRSSSSAQFTVE